MSGLLIFFHILVITVKLDTLKYCVKQNKAFSYATSGMFLLMQCVEVYEILSGEL